MTLQHDGGEFRKIASKFGNMERKNSQSSHTQYCHAKNLTQLSVDQLINF